MAVTTPTSGSTVAGRQSLRFGSLDIAFDARVLRPRPWTTAQSEWAAELLPELPEGPALELCAGAGQIGLLAIAREPRELVAVDLNPVACAYVAQNAAAAGLAEWLDIREGALEEALDPDERFALVLADPPWVPHADVGRFPDDPLVAIDGGAEGLEIARVCVRTIGRHLAEGGAAILQVGTTAQVERLADDLAAARLAVVGVRELGDGVLARLDRA